MSRGIDKWILTATALLLGLSVLMVFSTTAISSESIYGNPTQIVRQHILHITLGLVALVAVLRVSPETLNRFALPILLTGFALLIVVLIPGLGHVAGGARRWLLLGPLRVQPGELMKLALIIYMASYIGRNQLSMGRFSSGVLIPFLLVTTAGVLLLLQPDFGSTVILMAVVFFQLVTVSRLRHLIAVGVSALSVLFIVAMASPYRLKRIETFLDPFKDPNLTGYQLIQSLIAVGSGGLTGAGLGAGKQKLFYLPAAHTDFIFAVIVEELGFAGAIGVLLLFLLIAVRGLSIARRVSTNPYLASLAVGCTLVIVVPALLNIGVVIGLFPTKGLVLPLVAYGGTAMIVHLAALGMLLRISTIDG